MFHSRILCQSNSPIAKHPIKTPPSPRLSAQSCRFFNVKRDLLPPRSVSRDWAMPSSDQLISPPQSQAGYGSNRFRETDRVRRTQSGGASAGDFVWNFFSRFFLTFWLSILLVGWKTEEGQVGRRGSRSGVGEAIIRANLWSYLARPPRPTIAQSSEMLSWSSRYRSSYRSNAYCSSSYSISVMVIIPLISPIQGLCSLIVLGDQRCHPDPSTIKPHIIPPHNSSQNSTFDSKVVFYIFPEAGPSTTISANVWSIPPLRSGFRSNN